MGWLRAWRIEESHGVIEFEELSRTIRVVGRLRLMDGNQGAMEIERLANDSQFGMKWRRQTFDWYARSRSA